VSAKNPSSCGRTAPTLLTRMSSPPKVRITYSTSRLGPSEVIRSTKTGWTADSMASSDSSALPSRAPGPGQDFDGGVGCVLARTTCRSARLHWLRLLRRSPSRSPRPTSRCSLAGRRFCTRPFIRAEPTDRPRYAECSRDGRRLRATDWGRADQAGDPSPTLGDASLVSSGAQPKGRCAGRGRRPPAGT
jgi:hypothetical protein